MLRFESVVHKRIQTAKIHCLVASYVQGWGMTKVARGVDEPQKKTHKAIVQEN